jgi:uncharacterized RDD family membrane protein YckC
MLDTPREPAAPTLPPAWQDMGPIVVDVVRDEELRRAGAAAESASLRGERRRALDNRRVLALIVDWLVLAPVVGVLAALTDSRDQLAVLSLAFALSYFFLAESLTGQTVGKALLGLRVVRLDGGRLDVRAVATRNVLLIVDGFFGYLVGTLFVICTKHRQRLGDLAAGTVVTRAAEHPHRPAHGRGRIAMLVVYPAVWLAAAFVGGNAMAADQARAAYLNQARMTCVQSEQILSSSVPTISVIYQVNVSVEQSLRAIVPPSGEAATHARLLAIKHRENHDLHHALNAARRRGTSRRQLRALVSGLQRSLAQDRATLRGMGLGACS